MTRLLLLLSLLCASREAVAHSYDGARGRVVGVATTGLFINEKSSEQYVFSIFDAKGRRIARVANRFEDHEEGRHRSRWKATGTKAIALKIRSAIDLAKKHSREEVREALTKGFQLEPLRSTGMPIELRVEEDIERDEHCASFYLHEKEGPLLLMQIGGTYAGCGTKGRATLMMSPHSSYFFLRYRYMRMDEEDRDTIWFPRRRLTAMRIHRRARAKLEAGDWASAAKDARRSIELEPNYMESRELLLEALHAGNVPLSDRRVKPAESPFSAETICLGGFGLLYVSHKDNKTEKAMPSHWSVKDWDAWQETLTDAHTKVHPYCESSTGVAGWIGNGL